MWNRNRRKRLFLICLIATLFIPVMAACTKEAQPKNNTQRTLRFASGFEYVGVNGEAFRNYTELFEFA